MLKSQGVFKSFLEVFWRILRAGGSGCLDAGEIEKSKREMRMHDRQTVGNILSIRIERRKGCDKISRGKLAFYGRSFLNARFDLCSSFFGIRYAGIVDWR